MLKNSIMFFIYIHYISIAGVLSFDVKLDNNLTQTDQDQYIAKFKVLNYSYKECNDIIFHIDSYDYFKWQFIAKPLGYLYPNNFSHTKSIEYLKNSYNQTIDITIITEPKQIKKCEFYIDGLEFWRYKDSMGINFYYEFYKLKEDKVGISFFFLLLLINLALNLYITYYILQYFYQNKISFIKILVNYLKYFIFIIPIMLLMNIFFEKVSIINKYIDTLYLYVIFYFIISSLTLDKFIIINKKTIGIKLGFILTIIISIIFIISNRLLQIVL